MPRTLPNELIFSKNKIESTFPYLALLDIVVPLAEPLNIFIVNNNENVSFGTPPQVYTAFPFSILLPKQSSTGEISKTQLRVHDVDNTMRQHIEALNGGPGTTVKLRVVNFEYMVDRDWYTELEFDFDLLDASISKDEITLGLGAPNMLRQAYPPARYTTNVCQWAHRFYGGYECKLSAAARVTYPKCNGTRTACKIRNNTRNFGGYPGLSDSSIKLA